jgi:hypothetical protein
MGKTLAEISVNIPCEKCHTSHPFAANCPKKPTSKNTTTKPSYTWYASGDGGGWWVKTKKS